MKTLITNTKGVTIRFGLHFYSKKILKKDWP